MSIVSPLVIALIFMAIAAVTTRVLSRTDPIWVRANAPGQGERGCKGGGRKKSPKED